MNYSHCKHTPLIVWGSFKINYIILFIYLFGQMSWDKLVVPAEAGELTETRISGLTWAMEQEFLCLKSKKKNVKIR